MREEIRFYLKNKRIRNNIIFVLLGSLFFILINGLIIYYFNPNNYYFYVVKKVIPYPAFTIGNRVITIGQYEDLINLNKRIYENAYRVDFSNSLEGRENYAVLKSNTQKEIIERALMENLLKTINKSVKKTDVNKEYEKILNDLGGDKEIKNILKYSSSIKETDIKEKIYNNLLIEHTKESVIYSLKMNFLIFKPSYNSEGQPEWDLALAQAKEVLDDIEQNPLKFNDYLIRYNDPNNYLIKNFGHEYFFAEDLPDNFRDIFYSMSGGDISEPVKDEEVYYILKADGKRGYYKGSLDDFFEEQKEKLKIRYFLRL